MNKEDTQRSPTRAAKMYRSGAHCCRLRQSRQHGVLCSAMTAHNSSVVEGGGERPADLRVEGPAEAHCGGVVEVEEVLEGHDVGALA